jgi:hypothetical protein
MFLQPIINITPEVAAAATIVNDSNRIRALLVQVFRKNFNLVWNNPLATPDNVVAALGTNAAKIFMASAGLAAYLNALDPTLKLAEAMPSTWTFHANEDGSATLTKNG